MQTAQDKQKKKQKKTQSKTIYDKQTNASHVNIGDQVLVKILAFKGPHKIADKFKFEQQIYRVTDQRNKNVPVFVVKGPDRTLKLFTVIMCCLYVVVIPRKKSQRFR